ncbi:MAG: terminase small subunit, partial [Rhizobacter sp.]
MPEVFTFTTRQAAFVAEYVKDFNGRQAAIRAGYSAKTAEQAASRLLRAVKVKHALAPQREQRVAEHAEAINRMELSVDRTKLEIARIAYFDPRKLFGQDGRPLNITELDDDTAAVVAGLDVVEEYAGSGEDR